jgi:hypothetical protein
MFGTNFLFCAGNVSFYGNLLGKRPSFFASTSNVSSGAFD